MGGRIAVNHYIVPTKLPKSHSLYYVFCFSFGNLFLIKFDSFFNGYLNDKKPN